MTAPKPSKAARCQRCGRFVSIKTLYACCHSCEKEMLENDEMAMRDYLDSESRGKGL